MSAEILQLNSEYRSPEQVFKDISERLPQARNCIIFLVEAGGVGRMEMDFCCQPTQAAIAAAWLLREAAKP